MRPEPAQRRAGRGENAEARGEVVADERAVLAEASNPGTEAVAEAVRGAVAGRVVEPL